MRRRTLLEIRQELFARRQDLCLLTVEAEAAFIAEGGYQRGSFTGPVPYRKADPAACPTCRGTGQKRQETGG